MMITNLFRFAAVLYGVSALMADRAKFDQYALRSVLCWLALIAAEVAAIRRGVKKK